jgi:hypothetical protein
MVSGVSCEGILLFGNRRVRAPTSQQAIVRGRGRTQPTEGTRDAAQGGPVPRREKKRTRIKFVEEWVLPGFISSTSGERCQIGSE